MEKYYPISFSMEARGKSFPGWQRKQSAQCPRRWLLLILLLPQRPVQKWRSELLLSWERGPWEEDGNITPTHCLLYLNDSLRDISLPTLVKDPDPLILLFFFLPVRQSTLSSHTRSLILAPSSLIHDYFFFWQRRFIRTRITWVLADSLLYTSNQSRVSQPPLHAGISLT